MQKNYDALLNEAPMWLAFVTADGCCNSLSRAWREALAVDPDVDLALPLAALLGPGEQSVRLAIYRGDGEAARHPGDASHPCHAVG